MPAMLFPTQVIAFLEHSDERVRMHAADYLADAHDPSPATAEDVWRAIDKLGVAEARKLFSYIKSFRQTDASVDRLMRALREIDDAELRALLQGAAEAIDFDVLDRQRDFLLAEATINENVRAHLRQRVELADRPVDSLWDELTRFSQANDGKYVGEFDMRISDRLVEALARHPEGVARALNVLNSADESWLEIFAVDIVGRARHRPALDLLLPRLLNEETDYLNERAMFAMARMGDDEVVRRLEEAYGPADDEEKIFAHAPLAMIKLPASEAALLRLLEGETDREHRTALAGDLCELCSEKVFPIVREMVVTGTYDPQMEDLRERALVLSQMTGLELPEAQQWRKQIERHERETALRVQQLDEFLSGGGGGSSGLNKISASDALAVLDDADYDPIAAPVTIRRDAPKVGRNDPCPCGSGKKYKKCCINVQS